jgi:tRNA (mo5U34)-methyltransferase
VNRRKRRDEAGRGDEQQEALGHQAHIIAPNATIPPRAPFEPGAIFLNQTQLREAVDSTRWYHTIDLGHGIVTKGVDDTPARLETLALPPSFAGLSVLDIGAWDGFFSFEAERRGAARVVAADYYAWHGQGWGTGKGKAGFDLARTALGSKVEDVSVDVLDLSPERIGTFDVVLCFGVLYHLPNPLLGLERVASVTGDLLILETVVDMVGIGRAAAAFYPHKELNNDPTNWWGPNVPAVVGMLEAVGFHSVETKTSLPSAPYRAARALYHWSRGKNGLSAAFRQDRAVFHARKRAPR